MKESNLFNTPQATSIVLSLNSKSKIFTQIKYNKNFLEVSLQILKIGKNLKTCMKFNLPFLKLDNKHSVRN